MFWFTDRHHRQHARFAAVIGTLVLVSACASDQPDVAGPNSRIDLSRGVPSTEALASPASTSKLVRISDAIWRCSLLPRMRQGIRRCRTERSWVISPPAGEAGDVLTVFSGIAVNETRQASLDASP